MENKNEIAKRKSKKTTSLTWLILLFSTIVGVLIFAYIFKFWGTDISPDPAHWGTFGDYFGMVVSLAGTFALFILSFLVYKGQKERDKWEKDMLELSDTPNLIFAADRNQYNRCLNVGKGTAHRVFIGKVSFDERRTAIKSYSIPPNAYLAIEWRNDPNELYAYYESNAGKKYLVKCVDDLNTLLIDGEISEQDDQSHKEITDWLVNSAERYPYLSLVMM